MFIQHLKSAQERVEEYLKNQSWRKKEISADEEKQAKSKLPTLDEKVIDNAVKLTKIDFSYKKALTNHPDHTIKVK
ncbi:MAG: hypothetical protein ACSHWT_11480 [Glaciecola sp.]|jgi:hypothetical protein